jgi:hypothetical protein
MNFLIININNLKYNFHQNIHHSEKYLNHVLFLIQNYLNEVK